VIAKIRNMLKSMKAVIAFFLLLFILTPKVKAQETDYKAYSLYVYNFMKYVDWPENKNEGDFIIVIIGKSKIEKELKTLAGQKKIRGRNIIVKSINSVDEINDCHLLYITKEKSSVIKDLNIKIKDKSILIVGEKEGLARKGAALSFATLDNDELSFDINKRSIEEHKLKISSALIKLGELVVE
jgi:hypothetical protein